MYRDEAVSVRTTCGNQHLSSGQTRLSIKLEALVQRWLEAYRNVRVTMAKAKRSRTQPVEAEAVTSGADAPHHEFASITERSQALASLCDRLLHELDGTELNAAEIRFVVHKHQEADHPRMDPRSAADLSTGELVWELRRLIAWAAGTLEGVAGTLEARLGDLDERGRELLQEEVIALEDDLATVKTHLADPVDWDDEFEHLLAGEVAPFDDGATDEDDDD